MSSQNICPPTSLPMHHPARVSGVVWTYVRSALADALKALISTNKKIGGRLETLVIISLCDALLNK